MLSKCPKREKSGAKSVTQSESCSAYSSSADSDQSSVCAPILRQGALLIDHYSDFPESIYQSVSTPPQCHGTCIQSYHFGHLRYVSTLWIRNGRSWLLALLFAIGADTERTADLSTRMTSKILTTLDTVMPKLGPSASPWVNAIFHCLEDTQNSRSSATTDQEPYTSFIHRELSPTPCSARSVQ